MQKQAAHQNYMVLRCHDCQYPSCSRCGAQAKALLNSFLALKTIEDKRTYRCNECLYAPCHICGAKPTKKQRALHKGKDWTCQNGQRQHTKTSRSIRDSDKQFCPPKWRDGEMLRSKVSFQSSEAATRDHISCAGNRTKAGSWSPPRKI